MPTHPTAAAGFGNAAAAYERGRPSYPDHAVAYLAAELGLGPATRVLDLAAGTGKLTRLLVEGGADVVAVEPVAAMRTVLAEAVPGVPALEGTAEAIPLPDGSVDAVTVAQAFHWFDAGTALAEIHRVLRPGGGLGLIWNARGATSEWVAVLRGLVHAVRGSDRSTAARRGATRSHRAAASRRSPSGRSASSRSSTRTAWWTGSRRRATWRRSRGRAAQLIGQVRTLAAGVPRPIRLPYRTDVFSCRRT